MRRVSSLVVLIALGALALPAAAPAAQAGGHEEDPIVVISGDVTVPRGETVGGVFVASGDVRVAGRVGGDVVLLSGDATVNGRVDGDLVTFGGQARLLPQAFVGGDVRYGDERPVVAGGAIVRGDVAKENGFDSLDLHPFFGVFLLWVGIGVSMATLGALLLLIAPGAADAVYRRSREQLGQALAIGVGVVIALPIAAAIAAITLVGLPLALLIILALLPLAAVAYCAAAWALGRRILKPPRKRIWSFLVGLAILRALALVPILGFLIGLAAVVFGLGLLAAAIGATRERERSPAQARSP